MSGIAVVQRRGRLPASEAQRPEQKDKSSCIAQCHFRSAFPLNLTHKNTDKTLWKCLILTWETLKPKIKRSSSGMSINNSVVLLNKHH